MAADSELCKCEVRFEDFGDDDAEDKPEVAADLEDNADADEGTAAEGVADAELMQMVAVKAAAIITSLMTTAVTRIAVLNTFSHMIGMNIAAGEEASR